MYVRLYVFIPLRGPEGKEAPDVFTQRSFQDTEHIDTINER